MSQTGTLIHAEVAQKYFLQWFQIHSCIKPVSWTFVQETDSAF